MLGVNRHDVFHLGFQLLWRTSPVKFLCSGLVGFLKPETAQLFDCSTCRLSSYSRSKKSVAGWALASTRLTSSREGTAQRPKPGSRSVCVRRDQNTEQTPLPSHLTGLACVRTCVKKGTGASRDLSALAPLPARAHNRSHTHHLNKWPSTLPINRVWSAEGTY